MGIFGDNLNLSLRIAGAVFIVLGFWAPTTLTGYMKILFHIYTFVSYVFINGSYIIIQVGYICQVWGNVPLMTDAVFLLFTNLSLSNKIFNVYRRKSAIQVMIAEAHADLSAETRPEGLSIIESFFIHCYLTWTVRLAMIDFVIFCSRSNYETKIQLYIYSALAYAAVIGWAISAEKGELPISAWYPYDATKSPAYELTYAHQFTALALAACLNIFLDTLVTSLISQCQCRFNLLSLSLRTLCSGLTVTEKGILSPEDDSLLTLRLRRCVKQHKAILNQAAQLQKNFSIPVLGQFTVSMVIICVTAYQMAIVFESLIWYISMLAYMAVMLMQVFIYCYHGNQLVVESGKVAGAVYECPWYLCSPAQRRCLVLVTVRAQRETTLKAGNLTELSLATFMAIVKASYTFFTVLQTVEDDPQK